MEDEIYVDPGPVPIITTPIASASHEVYMPNAAPGVATVATPVITAIAPDNQSHIPKLSIHDGTLDKNQISALAKQGYTRGMAEAIGKNIASFPLRIWLVDNSGSMSTNDGHRMVETSNRKTVKTVSCTRWKELQETVQYHIEMAGLLQAPTTFRLLNKPGSNVGEQEFSVGVNGLESIKKDVNAAINTITNATPGGVTPLSDHLYEVRNQIIQLAPQLNENGQKVVLILATDGLPTDVCGKDRKKEKDNFINALKSLESLPVWVVIRLCTDDFKVVEFYNSIDSQLELSIEVLDNFIDEAIEMFYENRWINYTLALHRMREMGFSNRLFDFLDERSLTLDELQDFCYLILGYRQFHGVPEPSVDLKGFLQALHRIVQKEQKQWHPIKKKLRPIVDVQRIGQMHGAGCTMM